MKQLGEMTLSEMSEVYNWTWSRYRRAAVDAWLAARETTNHPAPTPAPVQRRRRSHQ